MLTNIETVDSSSSPTSNNPSITIFPININSIYDTIKVANQSHTNIQSSTPITQVPATERNINNSYNMTPTLALSIRLSNVLYQLNNKMDSNTNIQITQSFIKSLQYEELEYQSIWEVVLEGVLDYYTASLSKQKQKVKHENVPLIILGIRILIESQYGIETLKEIMRTGIPNRNQSKQRLYTVSGILLLRYTLQQSTPWQQDNQMILLTIAENFIPMIFNDILKSSVTKTKLSHEGFIVMYLLIEQVSFVSRCKDKALNLIQNEVIPFLLSLLQIQKSYYKAGTTMQHLCMIELCIDYQRVVQDYLDDQSQTPSLSDDSEKTSTLELCNELSGIKISSSNQNRIGGISSNFTKPSSSSIELSYEELQIILQKFDTSQKEQRHIVIRALTSFLGIRSTKQLSNLFIKYSKMKLSVIQICLNALSSTPYYDLSLVCLKRLCLDFSDLFLSEEDNFSTFSLLLESCLSSYKHNSTSSDTQEEQPRSCTRSICILISTILKLYPKPLLHQLLEKNGILHPTTIEIFFSIMTTTTSSIEENRSENETYLVKTIGNLLLDNFTHVYKQIKIQNNPFLCMSMDESIPRLINIILSQSSSQEVASSASTCINDILFAGDDIQKRMNVIIQSLLSVEEQHQVVESKTLDILASPWTKKFQNTSDDCFSNVLESIAKNMFLYPSSCIPLSFLGILFDDTTTFTLMNDTTIVDATIVLIELSIDKMKTISSTPLKDNELVFHRLSPLLLLRRIPSFHIQLLQSFYYNKKDYKNKLSSLFLELGHHLSQAFQEDVTSITAEERRLSIEIFGRILPYFDSKDEHTCFQRLCMPSYTNMLQLLYCQGENITITEEEKIIKKAKTALYASCHALLVLLSSNNSYVDTNGFIYTFYFVLQILTNQEDDCSIRSNDGFVQLQTGCMEYIQICLDIWSNYAASVTDTNTTSSTTIDGSITATTKERDCMFSFLSNVCTLLTDIITLRKQSSYHLDDLFYSAMKCHDDNIHLKIIQPNKDNTSIHISTSVQTCLLNTIIVTAQRCNNSNPQGLILLGQKIIPTIVHHWCKIDNVPNPQEKSACVITSVTQMLFTFLTKTKSFTCFITSNDTTNKISHVVPNIFTWAMNIFQKKQNKDGFMRVTALKLLLSLITIDNLNSNSTKILDSNKVNVFVTLLYKSVHGSMESDVHVKKLAAEVLSTLGMK